MVEGWLYDGVSALRRSARVEAGEAELRIEAEGLETASVAADLLVHLDSRDGTEIYGRTDVSGWRLGIAAQEAAMLPLLPARRVYGAWIDRIGLKRAVAGALAASAVILAAAYLTPALLAPFVPMSWEKRYGDLLIGDFGAKFCNGEGGQAALDTLAKRLDPDAADLNIRVVNVKMVNAAALPGGNIVIFRELLQEADGPDEVAGVLAHEIGHVRKRHVTEAMIRHFGFDAILASFGGSTAANATGLLAMRYSRGKERDADQAAIDALREASISPLPTARFFERLGAQERRLGRFGEGLAYISSHPMSNERRARFAASADEDASYRPALSQDEWDALFSICHNAPGPAPTTR